VLDGIFGNGNMYVDVDGDRELSSWERVKVVAELGDVVVAFYL